ncbi:MAG: type II toxin-antitoxin system VapB family antitoxin [Pseudomonadota bacterium]
MNIGCRGHMKTTLDVDDTLFREAKTFAAQRGVTMRSVYEQALRAFLRQEQRATQPFTLRDVSVGGKGLQSGVDLADPVQWHELVYPTS